MMTSSMGSVAIWHTRIREWWRRGSGVCLSPPLARFHQRPTVGGQREVMWHVQLLCATCLGGLGLGLGLEEVFVFDSKS